MNRVPGFLGRLAIPVLLVCAAPLSNAADGKSCLESISTDAARKIVVLQPDDPKPTNAKRINTIEIGDDKHGECSYDQLMAKAREFATQQNANIIKIEEISAKNKANIYDYLTATLYKAEDPKLYEREIIWSRDRKLTWEDFKGPIQNQPGDIVAAATYCGFGFETNEISDTNPRVKILVYNSFYRDKSWAHSDQHTPEILEHEQGHFDICELYTRMLRERMNNAGIAVNVKNLQPLLEKIYDDVKHQYSERQERYEEETEHGLIADAQKSWENNIAAELRSSEQWSK